MTIYLDRGPFLTIPDKLHPGQYRVIKNPNWDGCLPDIITFTEFLKWNYTLDYGRYVRESHDYGVLPLPYVIRKYGTHYKHFVVQLMKLNQLILKHIFFHYQLFHHNLV